MWLLFHNNTRPDIQRPYAIATAGTPMSITFDYPTSTYTYRFSSHLRLASTTNPDSPPITEMTEFYLPTQHYKPGHTFFALSSGGRIKLDHDNQRAYVWFIDTIEEARTRSGRTKIRRVDLWATDKVKDPSKWTAEQIRWGVLIAFFWLMLALWAQRNEIWWDKKLGFTHSKWGIW